MTALKEEYSRLLLDELAFRGLWEGFERGVQPIIIRWAGVWRALREEYNRLSLDGLAFRERWERSTDDYHLMG